MMKQQRNPSAASRKWITGFVLGDIPCRECFRYLAAAVLVGLAYALRAGLDPLIGPDRVLYPIFYFAAVLIAFVLGPRPALAGCVVMGALAYYRFGSPVYSFAMKPVPLVALVIYTATVAANIWFIESFKGMVGENRDARKQAEERADGHAALFLEFNERAATYFQLISALMSSRTIAKDEAEYEKALADVTRHTMQLSKLHRSMDGNHAADIDIAGFLRHVIADAVETAGAGEIKVVLSGGSLTLPADEATAVAVVVMELCRGMLNHKPDTIILETENDSSRRLLRLTAHIEGQMPIHSGIGRDVVHVILTTLNQIGAQLNWHIVGQDIIVELALSTGGKPLLADVPLDIGAMPIATRH